MPRTVTIVQSVDGILRQVILTRRADGGVDVIVHILEEIRRDGVLVERRERVITGEFLPALSLAGLKTQFDAIEAALKQQIYT